MDTGNLDRETANAAPAGAPAPATDASQKAAPLSLNQRLPHGRRLPAHAVEYFNQLVAYYLSLPLPNPDPSSSVNRNAQAVANAIIGEQESGRRLNWGDLSALEMALVQLLPEPNLQRLAWNLRARYREIAGADWYTLYEQSHPPGEAPAAVGLAPAPAGGAAGPAGATPLAPLVAPPPAPAAAGPTPIEAAPTVLITDVRADLQVILSEIQRLRAITQAREEQRSRIVGWAASGAFGLLLIAVVLFFAFPNQLPAAKPASSVVAPSATGLQKSSAAIPPATPPADGTVSSAAALPIVLAATPDPAPSTSGGNPAPASGAAPAAPKAPANPPAPADAGKTSAGGAPAVKAPGSAGTTVPSATGPPATLPFEWQIVLFVIASGAIGGLISMLRRMQSSSTATVGLLDSIALDVGQLSVILSPLYGAIFAVVLYFIFMGQLFDLGLNGVKPFPTMGADGMISTYSDFAKLMVWAFIAGFAEQFVPDVLDRLTAGSKAAKT